MGRKITKGHWARAAMVAALLLAGAATAWTAPRSIHVEWEYTPPSEPAVTGFRLYQEGVAVHTWDGAATTAGDATVDLTAEITSLTLVAVFADGSESPHSAPYAFRSGSTETLCIRLRPTNRSVPVRPSHGGVRLK